MQRVVPSLQFHSFPRPLLNFSCISFSRFFSACAASNDECPFRVLGLTPYASAAELRLRYLQLAKQLHPDASPPPFGGSRASDFVEIRRAYEKAKQLQQQQQQQQQVRSTDSAQKPGSTAPAAAPQQPHTSPQEMKTRRQWEEQQRERARFWADAERDKNQTNTVGGQDASPYQQEILRRFQNKVEEEQRKREKEKGKNTQQAVDGAAIEREIAAHEEATVKAWKKFKEEMRAFGFNTTDSSSSSSSSSSSAEAKYKRRGTDVYGYKMWISREGSNKQKMRKLKLKVERYGLEAAAAAGLLVGAAAIVKHYKREKEKRREAEKEAVYNKQPHA